MKYPLVRMRVTFVTGLSVLLVASLTAATPGNQAHAENRAEPRSEPGKPDGSPDGTSLILLGTAGGPLIRQFRSQPASLLTVNGRNYLIDCGEGTASRLVQAGLEPADIQNVFLTHLHLDHIAGLPSLIAFAWSSPRSRTIRIYGPNGTSQLVESTLSLNRTMINMYDEVLARPVPIDRMAEGITRDLTVPRTVYQDENVKVIAVENSHYAKGIGTRSYGTPRSYSYRFETKDRTIVFTGDTGPSAAVTKLAEGADILVSEVIDVNAAVKRARERNDPADAIQATIDHHTHRHLTPEQVGTMAATAKVKLVVLTHLGFAPDLEGKASHFIAGVRKTFNGAVVAGRDLDQF